MDREGDQYRVYSELKSCGADFVVRSRRQARRVLDDKEGHENLEQVVDAAKCVLKRDVQLSRRIAHKDPTRKGANPPRDARTATLCVSAATATIERSWGIKATDAPESLQLNVVRVVEETAPSGEAPVEWILLTTLPVATAKDVAFVVDCYRRRWLVEEFFKALKTGCRYEEVQLESSTTLLNLLAILLPVTCRLLLLRFLSRVDRPATEALTPSQIEALRLIATISLPSAPTTRDVLRAIAALGGHIKNNGDPGWLVLYRGFRDVLLVEAARALEK
jgi:hypothetical protein